MSEITYTRIVSGLPFGGIGESGSEYCLETNDSLKECTAYDNPQWGIIPESMALILSLTSGRLSILRRCTYLLSQLQSTYPLMTPSFCTN